MNASNADQLAAWFALITAAGLAIYWFRELMSERAQRIEAERQFRESRERLVNSLDTLTGNAEEIVHDAIPIDVSAFETGAADKGGVHPIVGDVSSLRAEPHGANECGQCGGSDRDGLSESAAPNRVAAPFDRR